MRGAAPNTTGFPVLFPAKSITATRASLKSFLAAVNYLKKETEKAIKLEDEFAKLQDKYLYQHENPQMWNTKKGWFRKSPRQQARAVLDRSYQVRETLIVAVVMCRKNMATLAADLNMATAHLIAPWAADLTEVGRVNKEIANYMANWEAEIRKHEVGDTKAAHDKSITDLNEYRAQAKQKADKLKQDFERFQEAKSKAA
jgi:hypothetical protein